MNINTYTAIEYNLLMQYQNKEYGNEFLENITDYASKKYPEVKSILLLIDYRNEKSKKVALKNGYNIDYSVFSDEYNELDNLDAYTKENEYYKKEIKL